MVTRKRIKNEIIYRILCSWLDFKLPKLLRDRVKRPTQTGKNNFDAYEKFKNDLEYSL